MNEPLYTDALGPETYQQHKPVAMQAQHGAGMASDLVGGGGPLAGQKRHDGDDNNNGDNDNNTTPRFASSIPPEPFPDSLDAPLSMMDYDAPAPGDGLFQGFTFSFPAPGNNPASFEHPQHPQHPQQPSVLMPVPAGQADFSGNLMVSTHGMPSGAFAGLYEGGMLGPDPTTSAAAATAAAAAAVSVPMGFFADPRPIPSSEFAVDPLDLASVDASPLGASPSMLGPGMPGFAMVGSGPGSDLLSGPMGVFGSPMAMGHDPPGLLRGPAAGSDRQSSIASSSAAPSPMPPPPLPRSAVGGPQPLPPPPPPSLRPGKKGIYSKSGFDMIRALTYVATRENPTIDIGAVDLSCSFLVCDLTLNDCPIVYVSDNFQNLTGYNRYEIMGQNCRFLQSPEGHVEAGSRREFVANDAVYDIKKAVAEGREIQRSLINYRKGGKPFLNLLTLIPIPWDDSNGEFRYCVGFQIDLVECPEALHPALYDPASSAVSTAPSPASTSAASCSSRATGPGAGPMRVDYRHGDAIPASVTFTPPPSTRWDRDLAGTGGKTLSTAEVSSLLQHQCSATVQQHAAGAAAAGATPLPAGGGSGGGIVSASSEWHRQNWDKMLLENADDVVHVLSLKGLFMYLSPACKRVLEYDPAELVGNPLASVCHPSDIVPVTRELRDAAGAGAGGTVNVAFRVRRKNSGYTWFESYGVLVCEGAAKAGGSKEGGNGGGGGAGAGSGTAAAAAAAGGGGGGGGGSGGGATGRKYLVLVGRQRPVLSLRRSLVDACSNGSSSIIINATSPTRSGSSPTMTTTTTHPLATATAPPTITTTTLWTKLSTSGLILFASPSGTRALLDLAARDIEGTSIQALLPPSRREMRAEFGRAVEKARYGKVAGVRHEIVTRAGKPVAVETVFYPGDGEVLAEQQQQQQQDGEEEEEEEQQQEATAGGASGVGGSGSDAGPEDGRSSRAATARARRMKPSFLIAQTRLVGSGGGGGGGRAGGQDHAPEPDHALVRRGSGADDHDDLFAELKTTRCTSWQYELRQMEKDNRRLADELAQLVIGKKRKRRKGSGASGASGAGGASGSGSLAGSTTRRGSVGGGSVAGGGGGGGGSGSSGGGTAGANAPPPPPPPLPPASVKGCASCHKTETPEWRRGPSGNRDLCNSCGLRWAKQVGKLSSRNTSRANSSGSSTSLASDAGTATKRAASVSTASTASSSSSAHSPAESSPLRRELPGSALDVVGAGGVGGGSIIVVGSQDGGGMAPGMRPIREEEL
ncbi:hypothetical protein VTJ83DRAFT_2947 [Remersonia thermophila]|uniref:White collar 1 protein n=1 Tax=Remersonia thermophila TaxID=72144 RepID=A0ABR4DE37_9PEZI